MCDVIYCVNLQKSPNGECIHECEVDTHCPDYHYCSNFRCNPVCKICDRAGADCIGYDGLHYAECQCPKVSWSFFVKHM